MSADRAATILARFHAAQNALVGTLRELTPETAEHRPTASAWSAAQISPKFLSILRRFLS
jgi:hypothetical protein